MEFFEPHFHSARTHSAWACSDSDSDQSNIHENSHFNGSLVLQSAVLNDAARQNQLYACSTHERQKKTKQTTKRHFNLLSFYAS